jgi:hypothetical protein
MKRLSYVIVVSTLGLSSLVQADEFEITHEVVESTSPPTRVYVESGNQTYRATRGEEHCFYYEEHDHIRCFDQDPTARKVIVEERTVYRSTRPGHRQYHSHSRHADPIATGIGVGLAIGIPILIHNSLDHHRYRRHHGYRYDRHRYKRHGHHRYDRHSRSFRSKYDYGKRWQHRGYRY